jgi:hypothetical protein
MIPQTTQHVLEFIFPDRPRFTVAVPYSPVVIGRDPLSCSVVIDEPIVSKQHIQLHFCADKIVFAEDLGSANGTFLVVEGCRVKLDPLKHYQLLYDQHLELGAEGKMSLRVARRGAQPMVHSSIEGTLIEAPLMDDLHHARSEGNDEAPPGPSRGFAQSACVAVHTEAVGEQRVSIDSDVTQDDELLEPFSADNLVVGSKWGVPEAAAGGFQQCVSLQGAYACNPLPATLLTSDLSHGEQLPPTLDIGEVSPNESKLPETLILPTIDSPFRCSTAKRQRSVSSDDEGRVSRCSLEEAQATEQAANTEELQESRPPNLTGLPREGTVLPLFTHAVSPNSSPLKTPKCAQLDKSNLNNLLSCSVPSGRVVVWQFKSDLRKADHRSESWTSYSAEQSAKIEEAYTTYKSILNPVKSEAEFKINDTYSVDFDENVQFRADDRCRRRRVRRLELE